MKLIRHGITRDVLLIGKYALKFPSVKYRLRYFRKGMTANQIENLLWRRFSKWGYTITSQLCPSLWCAPLGLLQVQLRADPLGREPGPKEQVVLWKWSTDHKAENYGLLNGRVVCIDYA